MTIFLIALGVLLVIIGIAGVILPVLPSTPLVFAGLWLVAWADGYAHVGAAVLWVLLSIVVLSLVIDFVAAALGAKRSGASRFGLIGATVGSVFGLFGGVPGLVLGPFLGAFAGELWARRELERAGHVALSTWLGMVVGAMVKVALTFLMLMIFVGAWLWK